MNPLKKLQDFGQSVYLDEISRGMLERGELTTMVERDGLRGVTSNPAIFQKAIADSSDYDDVIRDLSNEGKDVDAIYDAIVIDDIQRAADVLRPLYDDSNGKYGFVSLEVSPHMAHDTEATVEEARRLWGKLGRPNVFIKVPGTEAGLAAITQLTDEGINVNVTLLFGLPRYRKVAEAYVEGLEKRAARDEDLTHVTSVASFFLSRIDVMVDKKLDAAVQEGGHKAEVAKELRGEVAIANAKLAYEIYKEVFGSERFKKLESLGAKTQRLLWASTSTKNPEYSDVKYVEALIGPDTINTMPPETMDAYRDHGRPAARLEEDLGGAERVMARLPEAGVDIDEVTQALEEEGVDKFVKPFDSLIGTLRGAVPA